MKLLYRLAISQAWMILFCLNAKGQGSRFSGWFMFMNTNNISKNKSLSTHFDFQLRSDDHWKNAETIIIRPGINIHLKKSQILTFGYALNLAWRHIGDARGPLGEQRIWQQYIIPQKIGKQVKLNHRLRLEERFIPKAVNINNKIEKDGYLYVTRFRYFFRSIFPIPFQPKFEKGFFTAVQNEVMFNITGSANVNNKFFDQNRFYGAVGWRLRKELDLETGYLNQYVAGRGSGHVNNHVIQFAVYLRL